MGFFDIILLIILCGFVFYGFFFGLIRTFGVLAGLIVGVFVVGRYYLLAASWLEPFFFGFNNLGKVIVFIVLLAIVNKLIVLLFVILDKVFNIISIIPFLKTINRLAGAILGFFVGSAALGLIIYIISKYAVITHWLGQYIVNSQMVPIFMKAAEFLTTLLPDAVKMLDSVI